LKDNQEAIAKLCLNIFPNDRLPVWFSAAPANDSRAILNIVDVVNRPGKTIPQLGFFALIDRGSSVASAGILILGLGFEFVPQVGLIPRLN